MTRAPRLAMMDLRASIDHTQRSGGLLRGVRPRRCRPQTHAGARLEHRGGVGQRDALCPAPRRAHRLCRLPEKTWSADERASCVAVRRVGPIPSVAPGCRPAGISETASRKSASEVSGLLHDLAHKLKVRGVSRTGWTSGCDAGARSAPDLTTSARPPARKPVSSRGMHLADTQRPAPSRRDEPLAC